MQVKLTPVKTDDRIEGKSYVYIGNQWYLREVINDEEA